MKSIKACYFFRHRKLSCLLASNIRLIIDFEWEVVLVREEAGEDAQNVRDEEVGGGRIYGRKSYGRRLHVRRMIFVIGSW